MVVWLAVVAAACSSGGGTGGNTGNGGSYSGAPLTAAGSTFVQSEAATTKSALAASAEREEHGPAQKAVEIARPFGFPITNSMAVSWIVAVALIIFARVATRDMKRVPSGTQNLLEWLVGGLYDFLERIIGPQLVKRTFWFFATVFIWPNCASSDAARSDPL